MGSAAYHSEPWADLLIGMGGAAAALAGLVFVAVSINLDAILGQTTTVLGIELLVLAALLGVVLGWLSRPAARSTEQPLWIWILTNVVAVALVILGLVMAGLGLLTDALGGLYWLPAVVAAAFLGGLANAWTLLVEVRRPD